MGSTPFVTSRYAAPGIKYYNQETVEEILFAMGFGILKESSQCAAGYPTVKEGDPLGRITATGKYRRMTRVRTVGTTSTGAFSMVIAQRSPFIAGEILTIGADPGAHVVTAVDNGATPGTFTVTFTVAMAGNVTTNANVVLATPDGSEKTVGFASHPVSPNTYRPADNPNQNYLLDQDYVEAIILGGALVKSKCAGGAVDTTMLTDVGGFDLSPAFDAFKF